LLLLATTNGRLVLVALLGVLLAALSLFNVSFDVAQVGLLGSSVRAGSIIVDHGRLVDRLRVVGVLGLVHV